MRDLGDIVEPLCAWYEQAHRALPWREEQTPYRVWISEIMLQQTRVEAVKGYFARFLQAFPTVEALAQAPEQQLLKLWEGLGYYNRARNLQKAAQLVVERYGGQLPDTYEGLLELPGIGSFFYCNSGHFYSLMHIKIIHFIVIYQICDHDVSFFGVFYTYSLQSA